MMGIRTPIIFNDNPPMIMLAAFAVIFLGLVTYQISCYRNQQKFQRIYVQITTGDNVREITAILDAESVPYDHSTTTNLEYSISIGVDNSLHMNIRLDPEGKVFDKYAVDTGFFVGVLP